MLRDKIQKTLRPWGYAGLALLGGLIIARADISTATNWIMGASNVPPTDCSIALTTGGTAQNILAAQTNLHGFQIQNLSTDNVWISFTTTAAATTIGSYFLNPASATAAGGSYNAPLGFGTNHAISVVAATTGDKISCTWW
jgi:hypothetical protein